MSTAGAHKTAIQRWSLSRPVALALEDGLLSTETTFFDYGCGRGGDLKRLHKMGVPVAGWDPAFFPDEERTPADVVNLGYVVNVIENPEERALALCAAWTLAQKLLVIAARLEWETRTVAGDFQGDGIVTRKRTFQKFFAQDELRDWIQATIGRPGVAAAPGVFYVFRETADEQTFVARRLTRPRRVPSVPLGEEVFEQRRDLLQPLMDFVSERGRLPTDAELDVAPQIKEVFGSTARAFSLIRRVTGPDLWETARRERRDDLLVYLALAAFGKRPKFGQLPDALRCDIRAFFGTHKAACREADRLLYSAGNQNAIDRACAEAPVGKILPAALYVHHTAVSRLPPLLRVYEGCGRQLAGSVEGLTLIKLGRRQPKVSYLVYPDFDRVGHPALAEAVVSDLARLNLQHRDYRRASDPPILHRKDLLVAADHPCRRLFARLTTQEESFGLLNTGRPIGNQGAWESLLRDRGVSIKGHQVTAITD
ncbi:MAG: DNA phosphorothioation-associated putative methyltransferase [Acidobacteria bacterium]|nr:DNA phosphorothioation-associated putative methyltransferase [Acidobacteriota bacterium]